MAKDPYKLWRKKTAKKFKCSTKAIDAAVDEGHALWEVMHKNNSPLLIAYRSSFLPMYAVCFSIYLYASNPVIKSLMVASPLHRGDGQGLH